MALAFDDMTPRELGLHLEAFERREEREWFRAAWMVSRVRAALNGKAEAPEQLLGRRPYWQRRREQPSATGDEVE